jgi:hypothetical protein
MDWLEKQLQEALERKEPPPGFAEKVTAAARRPRSAVPRWLPVAAAVVLIAGGAAYREHRGHMAKERVMLAMRITAGALNHIQSHVREVKP